MILYQGILTTKDYNHFTIESLPSEQQEQQEQSEQSENTTTSTTSIYYTFSGANHAQKILPGDSVVWNSESNSITLLSRAQHRFLVGTIELSSKTKYGMTSRGVLKYLFLPLNKNYPSMIVGCSHRDISQNYLAIVDFDSWDTTHLPKANLRQLLGPCGNPEAEHQAVLFHYNGPSMLKHISKPVLLTESLRSDPRVQCPPCTFNIDPPGCKDIDDVISLIEIDETTIQLWITISDVAAYITAGSELDISSEKQAFTVYKDGSAIQPMLPYHISESRCSLVPGQPRLGVSLILNFKKTDLKKIVEKSWKLTTVLNQKQYDYDSFIKTAKKDGLSVETLREVASGLLGKETDDPHEWVEAFMLTYNLEAAQILKNVGQGVLRKHEGPDLEKLAAYTSLGCDELLLLANKSAVYCKANHTNTEHYGLEASVYCHASSPIRRYADLLNQRVLRSYILNKQESITPNIIWLNIRQKQIKQYERDSFFLKLVLDNTIPRHVSAIVVTKEPTVKLWILSWKRLVTWRFCNSVESLEVGSTIELEYFVNPQSRFWKEKIVFQESKAQH